MAKKFNLNVLTAELFDTLKLTKAEEIDPKVSNAVTGNARAIARVIQLQAQLTKPVAPKKSRKTA